MKKICYNCFRSSRADCKFCQFCGFPLNYSNQQDYKNTLPCGLILFGRYMIGRVLGQGGFGITYLAFDYPSKKYVAIKEYYPRETARRADKTRVIPYNAQRVDGYKYGLRSFVEEAETLAKFTDNPYIVKVYRLFRENGTAYFVMDFIRGHSLAKILQARGGRLHWEEVMILLNPIMRAMQSVHSQKIIHRDIAPDNIVLANDGTVKLLDFGAARYSMGKYSRSLDVILKRGFAPVEQYNRHGKQGPYTDIYAMAATIYVSITGVIPPESTERIENDRLIPPRKLGADIPEKSEKALLKALSLKAEDRFSTMAEFQNALL